MSVTRPLMPTLALALALAALSACGAPGPGAGNEAAETSEAAVPDPVPARPLLLTAYIGRYPGDPVDGVAFRDAAEVRAGVDRTLGGDRAVRDWVLGARGPNTPVFVKDGKVQSWGCEAHNCSDRNWTIQIDQVSGEVDICYHEAAMGKDKARWYLADGTRTMRDGACPSEA